jgi:superfamily II DNA/RNA helicase
LTTSFAALGIPEGLADFLAELGFTTPFEVQSATIPDALAGRDIAARAPTGSGKTLAFGLPLLIHVEGARPRRPRGLVLAPTRELADQIQRELAPIARAGGRTVAAVYGGVGYEPQRRALARGVDVLVACPGRLADLIGQGDVDLDEVEVVVVDEADRMSDMGFLPEVKRLLNRTPKDRQTLLFSATLDGDVGVLTRDYQRDPARHEVGDAAPDIDAMRHLFWRLDGGARIEVASNLIQAAGPTIVFCRTRRGADRVTSQLLRAGASAVAIHGSRSQNQRTRALDSFTRGKVEALVATDVAARGIHVDGVACVLHFDPPVDDKTYVHRSGRTARAGASGVVVSFIDRGQLSEAERLVRRLRLSADLNTPAPASLQGARERLAAAPDAIFADPNLAAAAAPRRRPAQPSPRRIPSEDGRRTGAPRSADRPRSSSNGRRSNRPSGRPSGRSAEPARAGRRMG